MVCNFPPKLVSINDNSGNNCWCRTTGYKISGGAKQDVTPSQWFFLPDWVVYDTCSANCAAGCVAAMVLGYDGFLDYMLGQSYSCGQ